MRGIYFIIIIAQYLCLNCGLTSSDNQTDVVCCHATTKTENEVLHRLESNYTKMQMPQWIKGDAVDVHVSFYIESMGSFKVSDNTFQVDAYITMNWYDDRLRHSYPEGVHITDINYLEQMFKPDMYFVNARTAEYQNVVEANRFIHVRPSGFVIYSASLACNYDLRNFPFDDQYCAVEMMSYSGNSSYIKFQWRIIQPVGQNPDLELSEMRIISLHPTVKNISYTMFYDTGPFDSTFACIALEITTKRRPVHYVLMGIMPNGIIVIVSWVSFWIDPYATPARVTLCFTSFLTLTTTAMTVSGMLPPVSYLTALSLWSAVSGVFVFGSLFEFAIVYNYCMQAKLLKEKVDAIKPDDTGVGGLVILPMAMRITSLLKRSNRIDRMSRVLFPVVYSVFVSSFASVYIYRSFGKRHLWE